MTIATGRPDSVYGSVIVEYKDPNTLSPVVLRDDAISLSPALSYWRIRRTGIGEPPPVMIGVPPPPPALAPHAATFMM